MDNTVAALVLAGGRATRMGGSDKGLLPLSSEMRLLDVILERLHGQVGAIAINANGRSDRFLEFGLDVLPDSIEGYAGPLAGVLAGLDWAAEQGVAQILSVAADTPFFPLDLVQRLKEANGPEGLALAASRDGSGKLWRQPTFGLWPVALREDLRRALTVENLHKIVVWTDRHNAAIAEFPLLEGKWDPFFNVNTPDELEMAKDIWGQLRKT